MSNLPKDGNLGSMSIQELAEALNGDQKRILLPSFQRDAVWDEAHVELLWDSILRAFPIGSLLFARVAELDVASIGLREPQVSQSGPASRTTTCTDQAEFVIIDGQQRSIAIALGLRTWRSGDSARLWLDLGDSQDPGGVPHNFYMCSLLKPWGLDATAAMQREALLALHNLDSAALDERKRLRLDDNVLNYTWPVRAKLPVPLADLLDWLRDGGAGDWMQQLVPKAKLSGVRRQDLDSLFDRAKRVVELEIPIFLAKGLTVDELGLVFQRLNRQGYVMSAEELFFSALKTQWPQAHDLVWDVYGDPQTGRFLRPPQIVHLAIRLARLAVVTDGSDVTELNNREFKRLIEREKGREKPYLDGVRELLQRKQAEPEGIGHLHHCLRQARQALEYHPEAGPDDIGLPVTLLARLHWRVWHTLAAWLFKHDTVDQVRRTEMIRYALMDHFFTNSSSTFLIREPFGQAFKAESAFPAFAIYKEFTGKQLLEPDILTPEAYQQQLCGDENGKPRWSILQRERELVMWTQRAHLHCWFDRFDPTLYKKDQDLPYDIDHIIPQAYLDMRGRRYKLPSIFWEWRGAVLGNAGNLRYWPKALNRADQHKNLDGKYLLGAQCQPTPQTPQEDSYLREIGLNTVGDVRQASFVADGQLDDWETASGTGGDAYDWHDPERMRAFRRATEQRRVDMYSQFYDQVRWKEWGE